MTVTVAVDTMGGDSAPDMVIEGLSLVAEQAENINFHLFGQKEVVEPVLNNHPNLSKLCTFFHTDEVITGDTKPSAAVRGLKKSSMRCAIQHVSDGHADAVVSAGNTGAYMALSKLILKTLEGIDRPAITGTFPTLHGPVTMLDLGANIDVNSEILCQFALMGDAYAKSALGIECPRVALLNVGSEQLKGSARIQEAHQLLSNNLKIKGYVGYAEGDDIFTGMADVIVSDGLTGNIALKTIEGSVKFCAQLLKQKLHGSARTKLGAAIAKPAFKGFADWVDPRNYNGAPFLGLKGVSVKSHGGTDKIGFASAVNVAINLVKNRINECILEEISSLHLDLLEYTNTQASELKTTDSA